MRVAESENEIVSELIEIFNEYKEDDYDWYDSIE